MDQQVLYRYRNATGDVVGYGLKKIKNDPDRISEPIAGGELTEDDPGSIDVFSFAHAEPAKSFAAGIALVNDSAINAGALFHDDTFHVLVYDYEANDEIVSFHSLAETAEFCRYAINDLMVRRL